jgi:uncharacterized protein YecE (DUF72 family)
MPAPRVLVGTAAWALPRVHRRRFPAGGSNLERYATRLSCSEINSSFYRPHKPATYESWAKSVPAAFRFSVKIPQEISHDLRLSGAGPALRAFLGQVEGLGDKLGCLLLQLPPSLAFDKRPAATFFRMLRKRYDGPLAAEPRHATWLTGEADKLLVSAQIARVAADPARAIGDGEPGGWGGTTYFRLHGSPVMYRSSYEPEYLGALAKKLKARQTPGSTVWCIFDNTMLGAATANALDLAARLARARKPTRRACPRPAPPSRPPSP